MLHIVKQHRHLSDVLMYLYQGDAILLLEDAVYAALPTHKAHSLMAKAKCKQFVLAEDANARGLMLSNDSKIMVIDFAGFVELTVEHSQSLTWD
ncbi:sulfurtransferase TusB [Vibrio sp. MACH09]|uniref:sulfurtransferase complex subunit TusB n=1 Tax=Vibrio sp. MACH09 TaxID=3025122 RepID=UPI00278D315A|nr:sulfurtransferase complex subunit TusB [Vibrio sp. MACH09]GLO62120.1 sulfurtransferase TusB [Vibrio sp. MACH09]